MTLTEIETKMTTLLTKELSIVAEEFEIRFLDHNGSFNVTLYTEDNQAKDIDSMKKIKNYFGKLGAQITQDIDVYICEEDGYIGTFMTVKK